MDLAKKTVEKLDIYEVMCMHISDISVFAYHLSVEYGVLGIAKSIGLQFTQ